MSTWYLYSPEIKITDVAQKNREKMPYVQRFSSTNKRPLLNNQTFHLSRSLRLKNKSIRPSRRAATLETATSPLSGLESCLFFSMIFPFLLVFLQVIAMATCLTSGCVEQSSSLGNCVNLKERWCAVNCWGVRRSGSKWSSHPCL